MVDRAVAFAGSDFSAGAECAGDEKLAHLHGSWQTVAYSHVARYGRRQSASGAVCVGGVDRIGFELNPVAIGCEQHICLEIYRIRIATLYEHIGASLPAQFLGLPARIVAAGKRI